MCSISLAIAGVSAAGSLASYSAEAEYAADAETARLQQQANAKYYWRQVETFNNEIYRQDIEYAEDLLDYQREEFAAQRQWFDQSGDLIRRDYVNQLGTLLTRAVEETIAAQLLGEDAIRQGRRERATAAAQAGERGVSGNTVDMLLGDVRRQEGEALTSIDRNRAAISRQMQLEALGLKARADTAINQLPLSTFQPITPPKPPAPTSPVSPTAPVPQPSPIGAIGNAVGAIGQGYMGYYANRGQRMPSSLTNTLLLRPGPSSGG